VETVATTDKACTGRFRRIVAEKDFGTRFLRVIYNKGQNGAAIMTVVPIR
jgi:hypothetical protein